MGTLTALLRIRDAVKKLFWGVRVVGVPATMRGFVRLASLLVRRPPQAEVRLASGSVIEFSYPSQFP